MSSGNPIHDHNAPGSLNDTYKKEQERAAENRRRWDDEQRKLNNGR